MEVTGELISNLERRAMEAERETIDRYVAAFLADQVGELVHCRITGVQPFGFFATVEELGGDGLVPGGDARRRIFPLRRGEPEPDRRGERRDLSRSASGSTLRLAEANPVRGGLRFELPEGKFAAPPRIGQRRDRVRGTRRGRPANIRHQGKRR